MPFNDILNFTLGEVSKYISFHREKERRALQQQSVIAYRQALLIANCILNGESGEVYENFPFWTEDDIYEIKANSVMKYFSKFD